MSIQDEMNKLLVFTAGASIAKSALGNKEQDASKEALDSLNLNIETQKAQMKALEDRFSKLEGKHGQK